MRRNSSVYFFVVLLSFLLLSCSGYIAEKYKIIYHTQHKYGGSRFQMLVEDIDSIEALVIQTAQSFNLRKISINEARRKYFWLDPNVNVLFAYSNPISNEYYNLIILYEQEFQGYFRDYPILQYTYWIEFFSYSKYGDETEEFITLRDEFINNFENKYGEGRILTAKEATRPPPSIYEPHALQSPLRPDPTIYREASK